MKTMRKGISPLIAVVIIIAFVVIVAGLASGFFTGFIKSRTAEVSGKGGTVVDCGVATLDIDEDKLECSAPNWDWMVGRWHLDKGSGCVVNDSSSNSNGGTLGNSTCGGSDTHEPGWVNGRFEEALDFDGTDDYVEVPDDSSLDISNEITVSVWCKITGGSSSKPRIVSKGYPDGYEIVFDDSSDVAKFVVNNTDEDRFSAIGSTNISGGDWYHVVGVAGTYISIYINGTREAQNSFSGNIRTNNKNLRIGARGDSSSDYLNGTIDEVRIYNESLSSSEIEELYKYGTQLRFPTTNTGQTNLGKNFTVFALINQTTRTAPVSLNSTLKAGYMNYFPMKNISASGKLKKVRLTSDTCPNIDDVVEPEDTYC